MAVQEFEIDFSNVPPLPVKPPPREGNGFWALVNAELRIWVWHERGEFTGE